VRRPDWLSRGVAVAAIASLAITGFASAHRAAQQQIPVRTLTDIVATDSGVLKAIVDVRQVHGGRVLVNDPSRHRLVLFDANLATYAAVVDNEGGSARRYGAQAGRLISYKGDSVILAEPEYRSFIVIDPDGRIARTMAPPKASDLVVLVDHTAGFDLAGRLIYQSVRNHRADAVAPPGPHPPRGKIAATYIRDTVPILRAAVDGRTIDTIALVGLPVRKRLTKTLASGASASRDAFDPLPAGDEWALLPDGTVAFVRVHDYHIDWLHPDGTMTSTPKMPFDWRRITLVEKEHIIDSVRAFFAERPFPRPRPPGETPAMVFPFATVDAADLPDYYPPLRRSEVQADLDGNVWILPGTSTVRSGGFVWDVVNRKGEIVERVQLPQGRGLAGFGPGGTVYMSSAVRAGSWRLERGRVVR
jgi:hypothetical protein